MNADGSGPIRIKDVYEIVERLEDKIDGRLEKISQDLRDWGSKIDRIDREGSVGTREMLRDYGRQLDDHDHRLLTIEQRPPVTRADLHEVKGEIAALKLWQASLTAVASLKKWQVTVALGLLSVFAGLIGSVATFVWLHHG